MKGTAKCSLMVVGGARLKRAFSSMMRRRRVATSGLGVGRRYILAAQRILILTERAEHGYSTRNRMVAKESPLAKPEWGAKHVCESCGLKYYDMQRKPITCPGCGEKAAVAAVRSRRNRNAVNPKK